MKRSATAECVDSTLYDYQTELLSRWRSSPSKRVLVVLPTGTGKTFIAAAEIQREVAAGRRVLVLGHRVEMLENVAKRLVANGITWTEISIVRGDDPRQKDNARIQVASIATINRRTSDQDFALIIVDEAHRTRAKSYMDVLARYPNARVMGLTATPIRLDGQGLADVYEEILEGPSPMELVARGRLAMPRLFGLAASDRPDIEGVARNGGDFDRAELTERVSRSTLVGNIVRDWKKHANGLRTIVFAVSVRHAEAIARRFRRKGIAVALLEGTMPIQRRKAIIAQLRSGATKVVVSCDILNEGLDIPDVRCVVLARPTMSLGLYLQQCGRCLRPHTTRPIILDHAGNERRHNGTPLDFFGWELTETKKKRRSGVLQRKYCKNCQACVELLARECAECGAAFPFSERGEPLVEDGRELTELRWLYDGRVFHSVRALAQHANLKESMLGYWIRKGLPVDQAIERTRTGVLFQSVRIGEQEYESSAHAARVLGVSRHTIVRMIRDNRTTPSRGEPMNQRIPTEYNGVMYPSRVEARKAKSNDVTGKERKENERKERIAQRIEKQKARQRIRSQRSADEALAKKIGVAVSTIQWRKERGYSLNAPPRAVGNLPGKTPRAVVLGPLEKGNDNVTRRAVTVDEESYPSLEAASRALNTNPQSLKQSARAYERWNNRSPPGKLIRLCSK